jgi:hypothetical protein
VFVRVTVCVLLLPTFTLPKPTDAGEAESCRVTPTPERATTVGEFEALLTTVTAPLTLPELEGAKLALNWVLWPAPSVRGRARPLIPKPVPATEAWLIVMLAEPLFVRVTVCAVLLPTVTFPKLTELGEAESCKVTPAP